MQVADHVSVHPVTTHDDAYYQVAQELIRDYIPHDVSILDTPRLPAGMVSEPELPVDVMQYRRSRFQKLCVAM